MMNRLDIMVIDYKGYAIKVQWDFNQTNIHYHVWTPTGGYIGLVFTIVQARKWIDAEEGER